MKYLSISDERGFAYVETEASSGERVYGKRFIGS
jgi:hypothetical protein